MWRWPLGRVLASVLLFVIMVAACFSTLGANAITGLALLVGIGLLIGAIATALSGGKRR